ncbi:ribosome biogenesis GTP-binding protein YihA/YsxC [Spiroplasma eriocheiris]|uniref:Probable GTP-binding protein EngB n=1 Tax=Spiroplasma eriocheiris TaxID=315358 RepID=A0A0H3XLM0_9MOLU|nr:ribosome biogenesis GTP-binding protein YihA/YsxC [Spiroplasma eriocheiris]AHF58002.1 putative GTP binding protein [Spiroplasma eriocheiris CCTCC M 207170]AKM54444.1 GTP-binding protein YsxC [Spiroplasma eriocheiris]
MFAVKTASYLTSAVDKKDWINDEVKEICFLGKSNVGKSSFINMLTNRRQLAKVSQTPGKTRMLNFFSINNNQFRIVDAPGYGFAKVNNQQKLAFSKMMEKYLASRSNLVFVCLLVDLRHNPTSDDITMYEYLQHYQIPTVIIGTKLDKLKKNDIKKNEQKIKTMLNFNPADYFIKTSSEKKQGLKECWELFTKLLNL